MVFIYIIVGFILLLAILSFVLPNAYNINKSITLPYSAAYVFDNVADLAQYKAWNPWQREEPTAQSEITGTPKTVGHKFNWVGKRIGIGSLTLRSVVPNESVLFDLDFVKPFKNHSDDIWTFEAIDANSCKVTWCNKGDLSAGMPRLMGPMITKQLNKQFEQGLRYLSEYCDKG